MLSLYGVVVLCTVLCFGGTAQSYQIDAVSCAENIPFVREMVEKAFTMATVTSAAVKASPMDGYTTFLLQNLFNPGTGDAREEVEKTLDRGTNKDGESTGILSFQQEMSGRAATLPPHEVVIFCNKTRLVPVEGNDEDMFDSVMEVLVEKNNWCNYNFMYTERIPKKADIIQICPWFLQYAKAKRYHTLGDLKSYRARLAVIGVDKLITKVIYSPIDLLSLWDKCMFHEMMHTKAGGEKNDVDDFNGYGWKNCKKLSTDPKCYDNADSFAILGSALYWNSQGSQIDGNGKFTTPPRINRRWLGSGTGRGLDTIRLDAVKQFV